MLSEHQTELLTISLVESSLGRQDCSFQISLDIDAVSAGHVAADHTLGLVVIDLWTVIAATANVHVGFAM